MAGAMYLNYVEGLTSLSPGVGIAFDIACTRQFNVESGP